MEEMNLASDMETFLFEDVQRNPSLLRPIEADLSTTMASHATIADNNESICSQKPLNYAKETSGHLQEEYEEAAKEYRLAKEVEREKEQQLERERQEENRRKRREEKEEFKRKERLKKEEERKQMEIEQAILTRRRIQSAQVAIKKEVLLCSEWSNGRLGDEALGRQIHGLWMVRSLVKCCVLASMT